MSYVVKARKIFVNKLFNRKQIIGIPNKSLKEILPCSVTANFKKSIWDTLSFFSKLNADVMGSVDFG